MAQRIELIVTGVSHELDVPANRLLVDCLRYDLGLTGTKEGCSVGVCGACTVLIDAQMAASCITLAEAVDRSQIFTQADAKRRCGPSRKPSSSVASVYRPWRLSVRHLNPRLGQGGGGVAARNPRPMEDEVRRAIQQTAASTVPG